MNLCGRFCRNDKKSQQLLKICSLSKGCTKVIKTTDVVSSAERGVHQMSEPDGLNSEGLFSHYFLL